MVKTWLTEKQERAINQGLRPPFIVSGLNLPKAPSSKVPHHDS